MEMVFLIYIIERKFVRLSNYKVKGLYDDMRLINKGLLMRVVMMLELFMILGVYFFFGIYDCVCSELI